MDGTDWSSPGGGFSSLCLQHVVCSSCLGMALSLLSPSLTALPTILIPTWDSVLDSLLTACACAFWHVASPACTLPACYFIFLTNTFTFYPFWLCNCALFGCCFLVACGMGICLGSSTCLLPACLPTTQRGRGSIFSVSHPCLSLSSSFLSFRLILLSFSYKITTTHLLPASVFLPPCPISLNHLSPSQGEAQARRGGMPSFPLLDRLSEEGQEEEGRDKNQW